MATATEMGLLSTNYETMCRSSGRTVVYATSIFWPLQRDDIIRYAIASIQCWGTADKLPMFVQNAPFDSTGVEHTAGVRLPFTCAWHLPVAVA